MRDFALAISGVVVGGLITLGGTVLQAKLAAAKEARMELRGKLERLVEIHYSHRSCHLAFMASGTENKGCEEDSHANKGVALATIYFPELELSLQRYGLKAVNARTARFECDAHHALPAKEAELHACVEAISTISKEFVDVLREITRQAVRLRDDA